MDVKFYLVPKSKATTSLLLMEDVYTTIDEEPLRFSWAEWATMAAESNAPACGALGCVSGWIGFLTRTQNSFRGVNSGSMETRKWFPVEVHQDLDDLFYDHFGESANHHLEYRMVEGEDGVMRQETQREHADRALKCIREFITKHEVALRNHVIHIPSVEA